MIDTYLLCKYPVFIPFIFMIEIQNFLNFMLCIHLDLLMLLLFYFQLLLPRVCGMYLISGSAFGIYILKVPERFFTGKFNYLGHSHNWWHLLVVAALYFWHNTGIMYVEYRMNHACASNMRLS